MGRRALPKISDNCDLSQHFFDLRRLEAPLDLEAIFPNAAPLEIEVGSGKGLFLTNAASSRRSTNFLGIEIAGRYARYIAYRLAEKELSNARIIHGNAELLLRDFLEDAQVAAVHVYFPDPWWKKRHHKRRIMNDRFLAQIVRVLSPDGRLHFWTDVEEYFRSSIERIASHTLLHGPLAIEERVSELDPDYRTHFERRKRRDGLPIYRSEFIKQPE